MMTASTMAARLSYRIFRSRSVTAPLDRRFGVAFVDVDRGTLLLDPLGSKKPLFPVRPAPSWRSIYLGSPHITTLRAIADKHGLKIVEDAAQAHGAIWEAGPVGSLAMLQVQFSIVKKSGFWRRRRIDDKRRESFDRAYSMHNTGRSELTAADGTMWLSVGIVV